MRILPVAGVVLAAALALTGCGGAAPGTPLPTASPSASPTASPSPGATDDTIAGTPVVAKLLRGFWRVSDAAGEPADSWVRFLPLSVTLFRPGGRIDRGLAAQGDHVLLDRSGWSMSLGDDHDAPWLDAADRVVRDGDGWALLDTTGRTVARLTRDGRPVPSKRYETEPGGFTDAGQRLQAAVPGAGVVDVPASELRGTWRLGDSDAALTFRADGRWSASTSCESGTGANGGGGRYRVLSGGFLLMTAFATTAIGCSEPGSPVPADAKAITLAHTARSFRIDGDRLTLFDVDGERLGALTR